MTSDDHSNNTRLTRSSTSPVSKPLLNEVLVIVFLWLAICFIPHRVEANGGEKVLILHSYHQGYLWTDMIQEAFSRTIGGPFPKAELYVEYMNTKRQTADVMFPLLKETYKHLYKNVKFDVIVASDNNALDFLLLYRDSLFPKVPVVFCGINDIFRYNFDPDSGYTGASEFLDLFSTIDVALKLHPGTKTIAVITDATETGLINLGLARKVAGKFPALKFIEMHKLTAAQLSTDLKKLGDDTIVLGLSFFRDSEGRTFTARESMDFIVTASPRPVYTAWDFYMAPGVVGGKLLSGRLQGENAATLAGKILQGEKAGSLPIIESPTAYMFDYAGLQTFDISESQLPAGSLVTGRPDTFYTRYKYYLWFGAGLFNFQVLIISLMAWNIARRKREEAARQAAEEALRESESRYRGIFENIQDTFYRTDADGILALLNPSGARLLGYDSPQELIGRPIASFWMNPEKRLLMLELLKQDGVVRDYEVVLLRKDGSPVNVSTTTSHYHDKNGQILGVEGIFRDVTERREHEKEQLKLEKLESLGVLAGGIAHDFNNILTGIMGNISFALMLLDPMHKAYKRLTEAEKASVRAGELAHQLLIFARGGEPIKKVVSVKPLIEESISLMLHGSNVRGILNVPDSLYAIEADEGQISQVFNNIIINATQAMPGGGTLMVNAGNSNLEVHNPLTLPAGMYVTVSFADEGCGISADDLKKIFDPYFTTKSAGNGLGLASAYSIVSRHGGDISASSAVGKGSTFTIYLPCHEENRAEPQTDTAMQAASGQLGGSILIMDDEEIIRDLATGILEHLGYQVKSSADGAEAVSMYKAAREAGMPFATVIMDLTIPGGMGGKEAAELILAFDPAACLIVSSGYSNDPIMADYTSYGFSAAVAKPYTVTEFSRLLGSLR